MPDLLPCPFCGGEAVMETFTTAAEKVPRYRVRCTGKDCRIAMDWEWWSADEAAAAWNRRTRLKSHWENDKNDLPRCINCGYYTPYDRAIDDYEYGAYCPQCGAMMINGWEMREDE